MLPFVGSICLGDVQGWGAPESVCAGHFILEHCPGCCCASGVLVIWAVRCACFIHTALLRLLTVFAIEHCQVHTWLLYQRGGWCSAVLSRCCGVVLFQLVCLRPQHLLAGCCCGTFAVCGASERVILVMPCAPDRPCCYERRHDGPASFVQPHTWRVVASPCYRLSVSARRWRCCVAAVVHGRRRYIKAVHSSRRTSCTPSCCAQAQCSHSHSELHCCRC